jgi:hypothetical protein
MMKELKLVNFADVTSEAVQGFHPRRVKWFYWLLCCHKLSHFLSKQSQISEDQTIYFLLGKSRDKIEFLLLTFTSKKGSFLYNFCELGLYLNEVSHD